MKKEKSNKKPVLTKETVAHLKNGDMNVVKVGGNPWIDGSEIIQQCPTITTP
jgi:hypothetical protein